MQRRANPTLPLTKSDVNKNGNFKGASGGGAVQRRKRRKTKNSSMMCGPVFWISLSVLVILGVFFMNGSVSKYKVKKSKSSVVDVLDQIYDDDQRGEGKMEPDGKELKVGAPLTGLPLSQFSSLLPILERSDLVAIYFAAAWCPDSTPVTEALETAFAKSNLLLRPHETAGTASKRKPLSIVYVSSDITQTDFDEYGGKEWNRVPFENENERSDLKRHFQTCAQSEETKLEVVRRYGIPRLIVVDGRTHGILNSDGGDDVMKMGFQALRHWEDLRKLVNRKRNKKIHG